MANEELDFTLEEADWEMSNAEVLRREIRSSNRPRMRDLPLNKIPKESAIRVDQIVREHPYPFLIGAAVVGLALGALVGGLFSDDED